MVSFQCDGCQDVVKKPKLDSHGARCHASFTCIDCSKTFAGPAQWKGHTSCMSEEQKYHKSVYQEPRGRGRGRGQRGGRGGRGGGRPSYGGSGENAIPLGTQLNAWTAPPPDPVNNEPFNSSEWTADNDKAPAEPQVTTSTTVDDPEPDKKSKKSKKRKPEEITAVQTTPAEVTTTEEPAKKKKKKQTEESVAESTSNDSIQPETKDKKKKKKKSRDSEVGDDDAATAQNGLPNPDTAVLDVEIAPEKKSKKEKREKKEKESKKSRKSGVAEEAIPPSTVNEHPRTQSNGEAPTTVPLATYVDNNARPSPTEDTPSKKKSKSKEAIAKPEESNGIEVVNGHGESDEKDRITKKDKKDKKDKKKRKQPIEADKNSLVEEVATSESAVLNESQANTEDLIPILAIEAQNGKREKDKKSKKKKVKDTADGLPTTEPPPEQVEITTDGSKKSKKRKAKEAASCEDSAPASDAVPNGAAEGKEKSKKKSKRRDREVEVSAAT